MSSPQRVAAAETRRPACVTGATSPKPLAVIEQNTSQAALAKLSSGGLARRSSDCIAEASTQSTSAEVPPSSATGRRLSKMRGASEPLVLELRWFRLA